MALAQVRLPNFHRMQISPLRCATNPESAWEERVAAQQREVSFLLAGLFGKSFDEETRGLKVAESISQVVVVRSSIV